MRTKRASRISAWRRGVSRPLASSVRDDGRGGEGIGGHRPMQPPRDGDRALAAVLHIRLAEAQERYGTKLVPRRVPHETEHGCRARRIQEDATCMAGGTDWRGRHVMRLSVIGGTTHEVDGARSAEAIVSAWRTVRSSANGSLLG